MNRKTEVAAVLRGVAFLLLFALLKLIASNLMEAQTVNPANGFAKVSVKRTSVEEIDAAQVRIVVDLVATAKRGVILENLRLTGLRMSGLPVYAEPLTQPIDLAQGKETALPPIYVTIQMRDLTSTAPLREMIEKQTVHIEGRMVADLQMGFLDKLAVHNEHPRVSLPITQDVPVAFAGSPLARQAALGVLAVVDMGLAGTAMARRIVPGLEPTWLHALEAGANRNLYAVQSSYVLKEHETKYPVVLDQLGFRLSSGQVITTAEVKAPWEYDAEFLGRIKSGEAKLEKKSLEVQLRHMGATAASSALELSRREFVLDVRGDGEKDTLIVQKMPKKRHEAANEDVKPGDFAKVNIRRRASPNSLALISLQAPPATGGFLVAPAVNASQDRWEKAAVYRLVWDAASGKSSIEVVQVSVHRDGQRICLDQPVDASFYGSPIVVPEGVIGIVQDERVGAFLPADLVTASTTGGVLPASALGAAGLAGSALLNQ